MSDDYKQGQIASPEYDANLMAYRERERQRQLDEDRIKNPYQYQSQQNTTPFEEFPFIIRIKETIIGKFIDFIGIIVGSIVFGVFSWNQFENNKIITIFAVLLGGFLGKRFFIHIIMLGLVIAIFMVIGASFPKILLFSSPTSSEQDTPSSKSKVDIERKYAWINVTSRNANLRDSHTDGVIIGQIPNGTMVLLLEEEQSTSPTWWRVDYNGQQGWLRTDVLRMK